MSYSVTVGIKDPVQLCSANGLVAFAAWCGSLANAPALRELVSNGSYNDARTVLSELKECLESNPPSKDDVRHTVQGLIDYLADIDMDEASTVAVRN